MKVHANIDNFSARKPVVTMGMFDGVHLGHQALLKGLIETAAEHGGESVVVTFWPHPRMVLEQDATKLKLLTTLEEKTRLISELGVDHMIIMSFTKSLSELSAQIFLKRFLVQKVNMFHLLVGFNHRFGHQGINDRELEAFAQKYVFILSRYKQVMIEGVKPSSTVIRDEITRGNVFEASRLLGRFYAIHGRVTGGRRLGRQMGYPTANIEIAEPAKLIPLDGVYACRVHLLGKWYGGMMNIGYRPTVNNEAGGHSMEVHILDFNRDVYSEEIVVEFIERTRDETRFPNLEALKKQLKLDEKKVRNVLSKRNLMV